MLPATSMGDAAKCDGDNCPHFGYQVLQHFEVDRDERDFLADMIISGVVPDSEMQWLVNVSLIPEAEQRRAINDCTLLPRVNASPSQDIPTDRGIDSQGKASSLSSEAWRRTDFWIARAQQLQDDASEGLSRSFSSQPTPPPAAETTETPVREMSIPKIKTSSLDVEAWTRTDFWIARAQQLQDDASTQPLPLSAAKTKQTVPSTRRKAKRDVTSHYWSHNSQIPGFEGLKEPLLAAHQLANRARPARKPTLEATVDHVDHIAHDDSHPTKVECWEPPTTIRNEVSGGGRSIVSPFFVCQSPASSKTSTKRQRPPPGTVSCVPFPPLDAVSFGLIQEKVAHEPFWLLVAVTFLIRTKGTAAVPVFYALKTRFPRPSMVADPGNAEEILGMIRHLGLSKNRLTFLQKYAAIFINNPPRPGQVYRVKNYDRRDTNPSLSVEEGENAEAWEIGHMTQGKYALDSWRIFCRDVLLGRAHSWNGEGSETLQPEWMRVKPDDKELRAYLRWMWMREGFEWDPVTGIRTPLGKELHDAVNEGRVEYDDSGGLRILDQQPSVADGGAHA